ncbi:hypothetical protein ABVT39_016544 [Epinephelus coioides]
MSCTNSRGSVKCKKTDDKIWQQLEEKQVQDDAKEQERQQIGENQKKMNLEDLKDAQYPLVVLLCLMGVFVPVFVWLNNGLIHSVTNQKRQRDSGGDSEG